MARKSDENYHENEAPILVSRRKYILEDSSVVVDEILEDPSVVVDEILEDPSVVVEDSPLLHLALIDVSSVCLWRMLGP